MTQTRNDTTTAIVLAAGRGTRVGGTTPKQFLFFYGEPMVLRSVRAFSRSGVIDRIILVTEETYIGYCRELIDSKEIEKVVSIVPGGAERYDSVLAGLQAAEAAGKLPGRAGEHYVLIHDSARPYLTEDLIERVYEAVREYRACIAAVPSKDTVKIADADGFAAVTPPRDLVWNVQTPQAFECGLLAEAYGIVAKSKEGFAGVTDDAMVVERSGLARVKLVTGSYANIKITTPEDLRQKA